MDKPDTVMQYSAVLIKASIILRRMSNFLRIGDLDSAMELQHQYKSELEPLMEGMRFLKRN